MHKSAAGTSTAMAFRFALCSFGIASPPSLPESPILAGLATYIPLDFHLLVYTQTALLSSAMRLTSAPSARFRSQCLTIDHLEQLTDRFLAVTGMHKSAVMQIR